ncbi:retrovirus-related pol polyprotein from transposon TNT 1-94 [Tanacetum coccineum]
MTYDSSLGIVKFTNGADEIAYMMPHKIEKFKSLSNMEKEHKQSVYYRNEEDKRKGVDYVMNKILEFYKECLELGPEYLTGLDGSRVCIDPESVESGPLIWPSIVENRVTRPKKYSELSATEALQADCDIKATNIILQGLPPEVYALVSNHKVAKELWERIQLLMQGTSLTKQERECPSQYGSPLSVSSLLNFINLKPLSILIIHDDQSSIHPLTSISPSTSITSIGYVFLPKSKGIPEGQATQTVITHNAAYQADDLDAYDSDCDELNTAKVALMANLSHYGSDALSKVHNHDNVNNDMTNQEFVQLYAFLLKQSNVAVQNSNSSTQQDDLILSVIEQLKTKSSKLSSVKFGNDHVAKILGYGDYQIGNVKISRVYYVEGLGHNLFSVGKFCDSNLKNMGRPLPYVLLSKASKTSPAMAMAQLISRVPQQNGVVERRNRTLIEAARTMLIYAKAPLFLWAEAVATACYTQNRSIIRLCHGKTPYELLHDKLPDLSFFHVFGALCYPTNDSENLGKLQPKADIGIFIGYAPTKKAFQIYNRRTRRIIETIHVDFDELTAMASEHSSSGPALHEHDFLQQSVQTRAKPPPLNCLITLLRIAWDMLFPTICSTGITKSSTSVDHPPLKSFAPIDE